MLRNDKLDIFLYCPFRQIKTLNCKKYVEVDKDACVLKMIFIKIRLHLSQSAVEYAVDLRFHIGIQHRIYVETLYPLHILQ